MSAFVFAWPAMPQLHGFVAYSDNVELSFAPSLIPCFATAWGAYFTPKGSSGKTGRLSRSTYVTGIGEVKEQVTHGDHERFELVSLTQG